MQAFDRLAPAYDETFSHSPIGSYLRGRVQRRLDRHFLAGDQVLELGCGTGEDALYLAQRGVQVTATDSSQVMLDITRSKATGNPLLRVIPLDIRQPILDDERQFEGCLANFGPLNVLTDRRPLAKWLAAWIKPGGIAGLGVMGPLCLWEIGWHSLHGDFPALKRRGTFSGR
jgi:SAM-dependent methyltransferase